MAPVADVKPAPEEYDFDMTDPEYDPSSPEVMLSFYKRLFPYRPFFHWLNHDHAPTRLFTHREFAFTLAGDIYLRYNSFSSIDEFTRELRRLNPSRFEIGPVYNARPKDKRTMRAGALVPMLRELVFDIDMTDYDSIRTCCSGKGICSRCWAFISAAVTVLDSALREQFGFQYLLWVYSGRRGIHCWVSDKSAMALTDDQRRALVGYLEVVKGGAEMSKKVNVRLGNGAGPLPPSIEATLSPKQLGDYFQRAILEDQKCFDSEEGAEALLALIPDKSVVQQLRKLWTDDPDRPSVTKWNDLSQATLSVTDNRKSESLKAARQDIILQYLYPRIDAEVSKKRNHLLKSPFCVHPATGRVCVPIDPAKVHLFDPETVPTVGQLLHELNMAPSTAVEEGESGRPDWEKTSLKPYVEMLERHAAELIRATRDAKRAKLEGEDKLEW